MTIKVVLHIIVRQVALIGVTCTFAQPVCILIAGGLLNDHAIGDLLENAQSLNDIFVN